MGHEAIIPTAADLAMFADKLPPRAAWAAATAWASCRAVQIETGPGHVPLDVLTHGMPLAYKQNWARQILKAA
jgi:hypothetical protein